MASPNPSNTSAGKLELEPNVPQEIALKFPTGLLRDSLYNDTKQVYFSLVDGRSMYLPMGAADRIYALQLGNREAFFICKRLGGKVGKARTVYYEVWHTPTGEKYRADLEAVAEAPPSPLEEQLTASVAAVQARQEHVRKAVAVATVAQPGSTHSNPAPTPAPGPVAVQNGQTQLAAALKTVVSACHTAQQHAEAIGYKAMPQFTSEDIRTMANTLLINKQREGQGYRG